MPGQSGSTPPCRGIDTTHQRGARDRANDMSAAQGHTIFQRSSHRHHHRFPRGSFRQGGKRHCDSGAQVHRDARLSRGCHSAADTGPRNVHLFGGIPEVRFTRLADHPLEHSYWCTLNRRRVAHDELRGIFAPLGRHGTHGPRVRTQLCSFAPGKEVRKSRHGSPAFVPSEVLVQPDRTRCLLCGSHFRASAHSGGFLLGPSYARILLRPGKKAFVCSLAVSMVVALPGTIVHAMPGHIDWVVTAVLAPGSVPCSYLGAKVAIRSNPRSLERWYGRSLTFLGVYFLFSQ